MKLILHSTLCAAVILVLWGCGVNHLNHGYGGLFTQFHTQDSLTLAANTAGVESNYEELGFEPNSIQISSKQSNNLCNHNPSASTKRKKLKQLKVDSIPSNGDFNESDKILLEASGDIQAAANEENSIWKKVLIYLLVISPIIASLIYLLIVASAGGIWVTAMVYASLIFTLFVMWLGGLIGLLLGPYIQRRRALKLIKTVPKYAPKNRAIEYEVRCLRMIGDFIPKNELIRKVRFIKELGKADPSNPWLNELIEFEKKKGIFETQKKAIDRQYPLKISIGLVFILAIFKLFIQGP